MQSIKNAVINTIIIGKSKFICKLIPIQSVSEAKVELEKVKSEFPDATHYCYAYICGTEMRSSDDGEPSGTAGMPILNVLEKKNLNYVLAIVVRYFGGIKLGAGGLVRAYSNSITEAINNALIVTLSLGKIITSTFSYENEKQIQYILSDAEIIDKKYQEYITYTIKLSNEFYEKVIGLLTQIATVQIEKEIMISK